MLTQWSINELSTFSKCWSPQQNIKIRKTTRFQIQIISAETKVKILYNFILF